MLDQEPVTGQSASFTGQIELPCTLDALAQLRAWAQAIAVETGLSARCTFRLELVLTEVVTNIVEHSDADPVDGLITVRLAARPECVVVQVEDSEHPFDPTAAPAHRQPTSLDDARVGGLGIHLVRACTQQLEYRRVDNKNQLRMTLICDD